MSRVGRVERTTKETSVLVEIDLDGTGQVDVSTGVGFYDHMLDQLGRHGLFDLTVKTDGDLHIDTHHTIEDTALALGAAFKQALGDKVGIYRFGNCTVPPWTSPSPRSPWTSPAAPTSCTPSPRTWRR
ncbi:hypothetical protein GCM10020000_60270 [Streptomyces olivoverticillatus]